MNKCGFADKMKSILSYDGETGVLRWLERPGNKKFNNKLAGKIALTSKNRKGYLHGSAGGFNVSAHVVCWSIFYGEKPNGLIDHINGNRSDNRICNLRVVCHKGNARNRIAKRSKNSILPGLRRSGYGWSVMIGRGEYLGIHACFGSALKVRKLAEKKHGYKVRLG